MKTGLDLVMEAVDACTDCRKYNGALAVELLRQAFAEEGIATSGRDSYVRSLDIEWDVLVLGAGATPAFTEWNRCLGANANRSTLLPVP